MNGFNIKYSTASHKASITTPDQRSIASRYARQVYKENNKKFINYRIHCIRKILNGEADFGVFKPEEISYASQWNNQLSVTNEIRIFEKGRLLTIYRLDLKYNFR